MKFYRRGTLGVIVALTTFVYIMCTFFLSRSCVSMHCRGFARFAKLATALFRSVNWFLTQRKQKNHFFVVVCVFSARLAVFGLIFKENPWSQGVYLQRIPETCTGRNNSLSSMRDIVYNCSCWATKADSGKIRTADARGNQVF